MWFFFYPVQYAHQCKDTEFVYHWIYHVTRFVVTKDVIIKHAQVQLWFYGTLHVKGISCFNLIKACTVLCCNNVNSGKCIGSKRVPNVALSKSYNQMLLFISQTFTLLIDLSEINEKTDQNHWLPSSTLMITIAWPLLTWLQVMCEHNDP